MSKDAIILALACCATALASSSSALADDAIVGRVRHSGDGAIEACFDAATRVAVGDRLVVVRHAIVAPNAKATPAIHAADVGTAEITAIKDDGRCATARLTDGKAAALDWISLAR